MLKIEFDPEAYKTALFEGPFATREALVQACVPVMPEDSKWDAYYAWAQRNGADFGDGTIVTHVNNPQYLARRQATLEEQLKDYMGIEKSKLTFTLAPSLQRAFTAAAAEHDGKPLRMLTLSSTRETLFFQLNRIFPDTDLRSIHASADMRLAISNNLTISRQTPELAGKLEYKTHWSKSEFDLVHVNAGIFYKDKNGVADTVKIIAASGAKRVVFNNMINSTEANGLAQWFGQRCEGGIVPFRALPHAELTTLMQQAGYRLIERETAKATYDVRTGVDISKLLELDNLSFEKI